VAHVIVPFASLEILTQLATAATGILVVRILPVTQFAVYAIAVSVQASIAVLSDVGVTTFLLSRAGVFAGDPVRLAQLLRAARSLRLRLFAVVTAVAAPLLWWSLSASRPTIWSWLITLFLVLGAVGAQISATVDGTMALALLRSSTYQGSLLLGSVSRLLAVVLVLVRAPLSWVGLSINLVGTTLQALYLRTLMGRLLPERHPIDPEDRASFRRTVRGQLVNAGYYAFSSQITLWLVGLLSNAKTVAAIGALGRISNILVLAQAGVLALVAPRIARYVDRRLLLRRYLQVMMCASASCGAILLLTFLYPKAFLWLIGPKYAGLGPLLPIAMGATLAYALSITLYSLNAARGWIEEAWLGIPLTILLQVVSLAWLDVSQLRGALLFGFCSSIPPLIVQCAVGVRRFRREFRPVGLRSASA
jgi:O-antigen/teichoic acid export membrane protein